MSQRRHLQHNRRHHKKKYCRKILNCADDGSPTLNRSATINLSLKEIASNESQSGYIMDKPLDQHGITFLLSKDIPDAMETRPKIHSPSLTSSSCSMGDAETSVSFRMKSFNIPPVRGQSQEEQLEHQTTGMKLTVVRFVSGSTSCSCINDDHLIPRSTEESAI